MHAAIKVLPLLEDEDLGSGGWGIACTHSPHAHRACITNAPLLIHIQPHRCAQRGMSHTHTPDMHTCTHVHTHACTYRHTHHTCMVAAGANSSREVITRALAAPLPCQEGRQRSQGWGQVQSCVEDGWTQQRGTGVKTGGTLGSKVPVGCLQREAAAHPVKNLLGWLFV